MDEGAFLKYSIAQVVRDYVTSSIGNGKEVSNFNYLKNAQNFLHHHTMEKRVHVALNKGFKCSPTNRSTKKITYRWAHILPAFIQSFQFKENGRPISNPGTFHTI